MVLGVQPLVAQESGALSYLLTDPRTRCCAVVDPLPATADQIACLINSNKLICEWVLSTSDPAEGFAAASAMSERFLCARSGGPRGQSEAAYDVSFIDDQRLSIGHVSGHVWIGAGCASYVFDSLIISGCPIGAMSTVGRVDTLKRLGDDCRVMLHKPLDANKPFDAYSSSLGELKQMSVLFG